jgi:hypothetical protein
MLSPAKSRAEQVVPEFAAQFALGHGATIGDQVCTVKQRRHAAFKQAFDRPRRGEGSK